MICNNKSASQRIFKDMPQTLKVGKSRVKIFVSNLFERQQLPNASTNFVKKLKKCSRFIDCLQKLFNNLRPIF